MKIHTEPLSDVSRYLQKTHDISIEDKRAEYESCLRMIRRFTEIGPSTRILEIGIGTGWFPLLCKLNGISCKGLEISPELVEHARNSGLAHGVTPDVELGNIEEADLPPDSYDAVLASSVFEHVEQWREALGRVLRALKPGGVLFFTSTNKFCPVSGEYGFPLYGWLPDRWRYRLRVARQGPDIMKLGIDFNQFTYPQLKRAFEELGFSRVLDRLEIADPGGTGKAWRRWIVRVSRNNALLKWAVLTFCDTTIFVCVK